MANDPLEYYARPGWMTDPRGHADLFDGLPTDIPTLCRVVQGILLHIFWAERQGVQLSEEQKQEVNLRSVARKLARIRQLDARPLTEARPPEKRLVGNCRDFAVTLTAIRDTKVRPPARAAASAGTFCRSTTKITGSVSTGTRRRSAGCWWTRNSTGCSAECCVSNLTRTTCRAISSSPAVRHGECAAPAEPIPINLESLTCTGCGSFAATWYAMLRRSTRWNSCRGTAADNLR